MHVRSGGCSVAAEERSQTDLKTHLAHPARVYDYWLGGKDNYAADREVAEKIMAVAPDIPRSARANRQFLKRAVLLAAERGIRQFLDIGSGLPTVENTHEVAQWVAPDAHVAYVDNDPIVRAHGKALLADCSTRTVVQADVREPEAILAHPDVRRLIDFDLPVAVLLLGVLHFVSDEEDPYGIVARVRDAMAPGSYLIFSHLTGDADTQTFEQTRAATDRRWNSIARTHEEVTRFFAGFEILEPGIVPPDRWRPAGAERMERFWLWAGVGVKGPETA
jgi:SAM-dependent methyltransferase